MPNKNIVEGIDLQIWDVFEKSLDQDNGKSISTLLSFVRSIIRKSIENNNILYFRQYIGLFPKMYSKVYYLFQQNRTQYSQLYRRYANYTALHLKEIIWFGITIAGTKVSSIEEKKTINTFYFEAFTAFNSLLFSVIQNSDWLTFEKAMGYFRNLNEGAFENNTSLRIEIERLKVSDVTDDVDQKIKPLLEELHINEQYHVFKRQIFYGLKYWLYFLYDEKIIDINVLNTCIINMGRRQYSSNEEVADLLFFRGNIGNYFGWEHWDHLERNSETVYYPPMKINWMTRGFFIDRVLHGKTYFNTEKIDFEYLNDMTFLYDALVEAKNDIESEYEKWEPIFKRTKEQFIDNANAVLAPFQSARRKSVGNKERDIVVEKLSQEKIEEFKQGISLAWEKNAGVRLVFEYFKNKEEIPKDGKKLKSLGQYTLLEKGKVMFIDGQYYSKIFGIDRLGGEVSRSEDNLFFEIILKAQHVSIIREKNALEILDQSFQALKSKGGEASVIFLEPEYAYKDESLLNSERFISWYKLPESDILPFKMIGTFDNIPVATSNSPYIRNRTIVCDFKRAVKMLYKTNPSAYKNLLVIDVNEISDEKALEILGREPQKWINTEDGIITREEAITLIKTSILLHIETILDFELIDNTQIVLGSISSPIED